MADPISVLEHVLASSGQLTAWALLVAGGSVATIVSTSYRRPRHLAWRAPFLLFIPGWGCIAYSIFLGNSLVGKYLASKMVSADKLHHISSNINDLYDAQRDYLFFSLCFFGLWLVLYLITWTFTDEFEKEERE